MWLKFLECLHLCHQVKVKKMSKLYESLMCQIFFSESVGYPLNPFIVSHATREVPYKDSIRSRAIEDILIKTLKS